jgi:DNA-directed RNA polymerase II subunit RPB1
MMDNQKDALKPLTTGKKNKKVKSLKERLKGKEGRIRMNLMGKRVDFSARSVISPDANLALDELGVPRQLALELTIKEPITNRNLEYIRELHRRNEIKRFFINNETKAFSVDKCTEVEKSLTVGVVVERNLQDGDYVLFNRQPTLHKMSMMGHRVRVLPYSTFRLNLSVTTPYNADFDVKKKKKQKNRKKN